MLSAKHNKTMDKSIDLISSLFHAAWVFSPTAADTTHLHTLDSTHVQAA